MDNHPLTVRKGSAERDPVPKTPQETGAEGGPLKWVFWKSCGWFDGVYSAGSMQVRILRRKYSSSLRP